MSEPLVVVLAQDAGLVRALQRLLRREGFSVLTAAPAAPESDDEVVGILVDARLLDEPGATDLRSLSASFPSAPVLVMAARPDHPALTAARRHGALALTADFDLQQLVDTLRGGNGSAGVREPRRPYHPSGSAAQALELPRA